MNQYVNNDHKTAVIDFFNSLNQLAEKNIEQFKTVMSNPENQIFVSAAKELPLKSAGDTFVKNDRDNNMSQVREKARSLSSKARQEIKPGQPLTVGQINRSMRKTTEGGPSKL